MLAIRCRTTESRIAARIDVAQHDGGGALGQTDETHPEPAMWNNGITARLTLSRVNAPLLRHPQRTCYR